MKLKKVLVLFCIMALFAACSSTEKKGQSQTQTTKNGPGKIYWDDKSLKGEGNFTNGIKTGKWILYHKGTGEKLAEGQYVDDKQQGFWTYYHKNGAKSLEGNFDKDQKTGEWIAYYPEGPVMWKANYVIKEKTESGFTMTIGTIEGTKTWFYPSGRIWKEEQFTNGEQTGRSQEYYENGNPKIIAWYKAGQLDGQCNKWYETGKKLEEGTYRENKKNGNFKFYFDNGQISATGSFIMDKPEGDWKFYSKEGLLQKEGKYKDGKETGLWNFYMYPSRVQKIKIMELPLQGGMIDNTNENAKLFDEKGQLIGFGQLTGIPKGIYTILKDGKPTGEMASSSVPNDDPKEKVTYVWTGKWETPKKNGKWTGYYPGTKSIKVEAVYLMDKLNGAFKEYYQNGKIKSEGEYLNGKMNGEWKIFRPDGSLDQEQSGKYMLGKKMNF